MSVSADEMTGDATLKVAPVQTSKLRPSACVKRDKIYYFIAILIFVL